MLIKPLFVSQACCIPIACQAKVQCMKHFSNLPCLFCLLPFPMLTGFHDGSIKMMVSSEITFSSLNAPAAARTNTRQVRQRVTIRMNRSSSISLRSFDPTLSIKTTDSQFSSAMCKEAFLF
ncbi:hypothetical protein [Granulibacter bethesdensis]|uniref:hypothetical protein n=1 Tax=Granulibacter bethesdensis TaxID=364410 RepID=UPI0012FE3DA4|nr:hypothetical protein [Granulibacter bethesdensis]